MGLHHAPKPRARKDRTKGTMGEEKMEVEETTLPEENQEVDASIQLCHKIFALSNPSQGTDVAALGDEVKQIVLDRGMETLYPSYCEKFGWMLDENALSSMKAANAAKLTELDAKIKDAEENLGDVEVRDAMLAKAEFYAGTADRERALAAFEACERKTVAIGQKMEMVFSVMRLHIFHDDWAAVKAQVAKLKAFLEQPGGADWERKNRLKVYEGVARMACRDFEGYRAVSGVAQHVHHVRAHVVRRLRALRVRLRRDHAQVRRLERKTHRLAGGALGDRRAPGRERARQRAARVSVRGVHARVPGRERRHPRECVAHEPSPVLPARGARAGVPAVPAELQVGDDGEHGGGVRSFGGVPRRRALQLHRRGQAQREDRQGERRARHEQAGRQERAVPVVHQGGGQLAEQDPEAQPRGGPVVAVVM